MPVTRILEIGDAQGDGLTKVFKRPDGNFEFQTPKGNLTFKAGAAQELAFFIQAECPQHRGDPRD